MMNENNLESPAMEAASDQWFNQWVEEMAEDFEQVDLDEFILMD